VRIPNVELASGKAGRGDAKVGHDAPKVGHDVGAGTKRGGAVK
jgi:hypothetical protein